MSKKTSPQSRPGRRLRNLRVGSKTTSRPSRTPDAAPQAPTTTVGRVRRYVPVVAIPLAILVLGLIVVGLSGLMITGLSPTAARWSPRTQ